MEPTITATRTQIIAAFRKWIDGAPKTSCGTYYLDNRVEPAASCADALISILAEA